MSDAGGAPRAPEDVRYLEDELPMSDKLWRARYLGVILFGGLLVLVIITALTATPWRLASVPSAATSGALESVSCSSTKCAMSTASGFMFTTAGGTAAEPWSVASNAGLAGQPSVNSHVTCTTTACAYSSESGYATSTRTQYGPAPPPTGRVTGLACDDGTICLALAHTVNTRTTPAIYQEYVSSFVGLMGATGCCGAHSTFRPVGAPSTLLGPTKLVCIAALTCVAYGGDAPELLLTTDGGITWREMPSAHQGTPRALSCPTVTFCAYGSAQGVISVTKEGGAHWRSGEPAPWRNATGELDVNAIYCADEHRCRALGTGAGGNTIVVTSDAGATWRVEKIPGGLLITDLACLDFNHCWAIGQTDNAVQKPVLIKLG